MRIHTEGKPYGCLSCSKGFTCSKLLIVDMRTHTDIQTMIIAVIVVILSMYIARIADFVVLAKYTKVMDNAVTVTMPTNHMTLMYLQSCDYNYHT